ncbi:MAG: hypothetical protein HW382_962 [Deltaproteobacteria bacterium]|nr:hypothetical protein [Deltaproteobacteria bacterium]MBM2839335.1 hypothetical protein [Deltaproteobacteria bacterium]
MKRKLVVFLLGLSLAYPLAVKADVNDALLQKLVEKGTITSEEAQEIQSKNPLNGLKIGGVAYLDYSFGQTGGAATTDFNQFTLTRAYININKEITPWFKVRITPDLYSDTTNGYVVRMKYAYADFLTPDMGHLTDNGIRIGLVQLPWLDFEESLNGYRMQSTMFQDKQKLVTSSDGGVSILGNIGGKLSKEQIAEVGNKSYAGKYGSYHIGLYNGGGYSKTTDSNQNKSIQGRLTVRPLPDILPGLQLTYFGVSGKGNTAAEPDWTNNTGFISYQQKYFVASGEHYSGKGNFSGGDSNSKSGYSFFGKVVLPMYEKVTLFGRYDLLDPNTDASNNNIETTIAGASYRIYSDNYIVAAYEKTHNEANANPDDTKGQIVLQISF